MTIQDNIDTIRGAVKGKDVREAIAQLGEAIRDIPDVSDSLDDLNTAVTNANNIIATIGTTAQNAADNAATTAATNAVKNVTGQLQAAQADANQTIVDLDNANKQVNKQLIDAQSIIISNENTLAQVQEQSENIQSIAAYNQDQIDKGTVATQDQINSISSSLEDITNKRLLNFITPEMFGAKGDGTTDDTESLNNAFQYALDNNVTLLSKRDKKYKVSSTISLDLKTGASVLTNKRGLNVDFGFGTIVTETEVNPIFNITMFSGGKVQDNTIENIRFLCNELSNPILINNGNLIKIKNIYIIDPKDYCININKGAIFLDTGYFAKYSFTNTESVGILVTAGTDSKMRNILMQDFKYAVVDNGDANFYHNFHPWVMTPSQIIGSNAFKFKCGGNMNECYIDTYENAIELTGEFTVNVVDTHCFINTTFYNDDVTTVKPTMFKSNNAEYLNRVVMEGCYLRFPFISNGVMGGNFSNIDPKLLTDESFIDLTKNNRIENCGMLPCISGGESSLILQTGYTAVTNKLINREGKIKVELKLDCQTDFPTSFYGNLGDFPEGYKTKISSNWVHRTAYIYNSSEENIDNPSLVPVDIYIKCDAGVNCIFVKVPSGADVSNKRRIYCNFELEGRYTSYFNNKFCS